jgi:membrane-associated phospholipid phosphatase
MCSLESEISSVKFSTKLQLSKGSQTVQAIPAARICKFGRPRVSALILLALLHVFFAGTIAHAQSPTPEKDAPAAASHSEAQPLESSTAPVNFKSLPKNLFMDQKDFWTAPFHMTQKQWEWAFPAILAGGGLILADKRLEKHVPTDPSTVSHAVTASNAGVAALAGAGAGFFLLGQVKSNDQERETGILSGEAAIGALIDTEIFSYAAGRERPFTGTSPGRFFVGGDSFPSTHASISWAIASVIAHEYPGPLTQLLAYGAAGGVSAARFAGQKHFASDIVIGSALGWYMGRQVYMSRSHYSDADIAKYGTFDNGDDNPHRNLGSSYVPLDSWVYPALERLAALGYIQTDSLSIRPWTRLECQRLLGEAEDHGADSDAPEDVERLYAALSTEFKRESDLMDGERNLGVQPESAYSRFLGISGTPLTDNYHFGQTLLNDYGRPYEEGFNAVDGASGWGTVGPFVLYARGEYQYSPSAPAPTQAELNFFGVDQWPNGPALPVASISRFKLLDTYLGMNFANWQISFGRRSFWWGPSEGGTMLYSNNAAPLSNMVTLDRVTPFRLPWLFRYLGDIRFEGFIGHMTGLQFQTTVYSGATMPAVFGQYGKNLHPQPFLSGGKLSFKLTPNFEFGMAKTTIYGGPGNPVNVTTFLQSTFGVHVHGDVLGDGRTTADVSYRVPGLRDWLTFYAESFSEDEISPIPYLRKSSSQGGLYFPKLPWMNKLDLRLEGGYTDPIVFCGSCTYSNAQYVSGYNNDGRLIGTWIGRAAQGELIRTNYWLSPKRKIGLELRHRTIDRQFLPQGGNQNDVAVNADIFAGSGFRFSSNLQYERWDIPLLATTRQSNVAASLQFSFWPTPKSQ